MKQPADWPYALGPQELRTYLEGRCEKDGKHLVWTGGLDEWGAPKTRIPGASNGRTQRGPTLPARRLMLEALGRPALPGKLAVAKCEVEGCMAEKCLTWWTRKQLQQRSSPKVAANPVRNARVAIAARERLGKLTMAKARQMRLMKAADPTLTTYQLGPMFGVTQRAASDVLRGHTWKEYGLLFTSLIDQGRASLRPATDGERAAA